MPRKTAELTAKWYCGAGVPMRLIRRFAKDVAERFAPERIILFGSRAYGVPHADSDVDVLVLMPCANELDQAMSLRRAVKYPFPLDLLVRTPKNLAWRLAEGGTFLTEFITKGVVLHEANDCGMSREGRRRPPRREDAGHTLAESGGLVPALDEPHP